METTKHTRLWFMRFRLSLIVIALVLPHARSNAMLLSRMKVKECSAVVKESIKVGTEEEFQEQLDKVKQKIRARENLTIEDLRFVYGMEIFEAPNLKKEKSQYKSLKKIRKFRNSKTDLAKIYNIDSKEVSSTMKDFQSFFMKDKVKVFYGNLNYDGKFRSSKLKNLIAIHGNADFGPLNNAFHISFLTHVFGDISLPNITRTGSLNLQVVTGSLDLPRAVGSVGLGRLRFIGKDANFPNLKFAGSFSDLEYIGGYADFPMVTDLSWDRPSPPWWVGFMTPGHTLDDLVLGKVNFSKLRYIGGSANFGKLDSVRGLLGLKYIGGDRNFGSLEDGWHWAGNGVGFRQD